MKLVSIYNRAAYLALFLTLTAGLVVPVLAQTKEKNAGPPPASQKKYPPPLKMGRPEPTPFLTVPLFSKGQEPVGMVPSRRNAMRADSTFIPPDVAVRSVKGSTTGNDKAGGSRLRIGGTNGASVIEKVVNVNRTDVLDERTPNWTSDEQFLYFVANTTANPNRYALFRLSAGDPADVTTPSPNAKSNPADTQFDYLFPSVNANGSRIAFLRSSDGKGIDDETKVWNLYVSNIPAPDQFVDTQERGANNLRPLTAGRDFPDGNGGHVAITNVGRPAWIGSNDVVFSGKLGNSPNYHIFSVNVQTGVIFQLTDGPADERNPSVSPDGRSIAFDSNSQALTTGQSYVSAPTDGTRRVRSETDPRAIPASGQNPGSIRNVFTMSVLGQNVAQFTGRFTGMPATNSVEPAWSSSERNNFTNANGNTFYLAFSSNRIPTFAQADTTQSTITGWQPGSATASSIYYVVASRNRGDTILTEAAPTDLNNVDADGARRLDTANDTLVNGRLNDVTRPRFRDRYPTWSPILQSFRIGFQSNRNGNYATNSFGSGFTPTAQELHNTFFASVIDITAPNLIRFDTNSPTGEVVHINLVTNQNKPFDPSLTSTVRTRDNGITPGSLLHFAVRVEDRESGLRPEDNTDGGAVYLQFKNPNSKYQSLAQGGLGVEHKEFGRQSSFVLFENNATTSFTNTNTGYTVGPEYECQAISAAGVINTFTSDSAQGTLYYSHRFNNRGQGPLYEVGFNDSFAYSGIFMPPLDGNNGRANVWLKLSPIVELNEDGTPRRDSNGNTIPVRPSDGSGGVLYGATWKIPDEASDWYIDVIAYDNAVHPFSAGEKYNAIIYDNVWGFSSAAPLSGQATDVLVVMDYALGQKFFATRFGEQSTGTVTGFNLQPIEFGAESYYTDVDLSLFPMEQADNAAPPAPGGTTPRFWSDAVSHENPFRVSPQNGLGAFGFWGTSGMPNTLGVESYIDEYLQSGSVVVDSAAGYRLPPTGRYSLWRVLSRGAVPASLLTDYLPQVTSAPPDTLHGESQNRTIQHSTRFVVWASPFSGNVFVGPGSITDIQTQNSLEAFVLAGGRLFISGQDIGWALVGNGQQNRFFNSILRAQYGGDDAGAVIGLNAADTTVAGNYIGQLRQDAWQTTQAFGRFNVMNPPYVYVPLNATTQNGVDLPYTNFWQAGPVGDAAFTANGTSGRPDIIRAVPDTTPAGLPANTVPDATDEYLYNTTPGAPPAIAAPGVAPTQGTHFSAIIAASHPIGTSATGLAPPYDPNKTFVPQGKVIYAACGFESISQAFYTYSVGNPSRTYIATFGRRSELMQNISEVFRTGIIIGKVVDDNGAPVNDALVRAVPNNANDQQVATGTALTDENGNFQIVGLQPGTYFVFGYKPGFYSQHDIGNSVHGGWRSSTNVSLKRASPGQLTGIRNTQNNSFGGVFGPDGLSPIPGIEIQVRRREPDGRYTLISTISHDGINPVTLPDGSQVVLPAGAYSFPTLSVANYQVFANARTTIVDGKVVAKTRGQDGKLPGVNEAYGEVRVLGGNQPEVQLGPGTVVVPDPFPNVPNPIGPTVQIRENTTSQINFLLPATPQKVEGTVVDQDTNQPLKDAFVTAILKANGQVVANGTTDANGKYSLIRTATPEGLDPTLIPAGTYTISATVNGYSSAVPPSEVNNIDVTIGGTLDPVLTIPQLRLKKLPPGSLSGLVRRFNGLITTTTGVDGAVVTLYAVSTVNGVQQQATDPSYTIPVSATPTTAPDGYVYNFKLDEVSPGTYNAYVSKAGLTGNPSPVANIVVTTGQETRNINFTLEPVKIYGEGVQLISVPQDFSTVPTRQIFGLVANGDNNGDGTTNQLDQQIYNTFNVADWTGTEYQISPDLPLRLGKGYFARFGSVSSVVAVGTPTDTATYTINLSNGWNLIGHPFSNQQSVSDPAADIDITSVDLVTYSYTTTGGQQRQNVSLQQAVSDGALQSVVYSYTGSNGGGAYVQGSLLKQWFGYWFRAFVPVQMTVKYPGGATRAVKASKANGGKFRSVTTAERETPILRNIASKALNDWRIQIAAQQGNLRDTDNSVGVSPDASEGFDNKYDAEKPPLVRDVPGLYVGIQGTNIAGRATSFSDNVKAANGQTKSWEFTVESTDGSNEVMVYWPNISRLPRGVDPVLVDVTTGRRVAMRSSSAFRFTPSGRAQRKFRVEVAPPTSLPLDILNLRAAPTRGLNGATYRFSFLTTRAVDVDAEVKSLAGRTLKRFKTRATGGAETSIVWDGRDERGSQLPPGPYMLSISAQDERGGKVSRNVPFMTMQ